MSNPINRILTALLITSLLSVFAFSADWVSFNGWSESECEVTALSSDGSSTLIQIEVPGMFVEAVDVEGEIFHYLQFHHFASTQDIGSPALPIVAELAAIPGMSKVKATIVSEETMTLEGYKIYPFQKPTTDDKPAAEFYLDEKVYSTNAFYPGERVELGQIGIMRDLRVVPLRVTPFSYNPVTEELVVSTKMVVKLEYYGISDEAVKTEPVKDVSPRIAGWYRSTVINYDELNIGVSGATDEFLVKYLIVATDEALDILEPLVEFRNAQGLGVEVRTLGPGFSTAEQIHDYIHDLYVSDGLEYVLMVGDWCPTTGHEIMPMYYWSNTWSDSWYSMVDPWPNYNNDYLADLAIGRIVYDNLGEFQHQMNKLMGYLLEPSTADNWAEHTLLVAHEQQYPLKYTQCKEQIRTFPYAIQTPIFGTAYGGAGATNQNVIDYLNNEGSGILNYRGHGSTTAWTGWGPSGNFTATHINQLTNADKLFIHFDVCCSNMDFPGYNGNCFSESFMKADYGCVATNAAIVPSYTIPNHDYDKEYYKAVYDEGLAGIGYQSNFANVTVYVMHGTLGESNIRTYLWLGDSAIDPWTNVPQVLTVTHLPVFYIGMSDLDVNVTKSGVPVEDAMVCGQNDEVYSVDYTDATGSVTLHFDSPVVQPGELTLTVTCHNGLPYQFDIPVIPADGPYITFNSVDINDAAAWMPNGQLDFGEQDVMLTVTLENVGVETAEDVNAALTTDDIYTTIIDDNAFYGDIGAGLLAVVIDGFEIEVTPDIPDMHAIPFVLTAVSGDSAWVSVFSIMAHAPIIEFERLVISDPTGNNNNQLDPGETADFAVYIMNNGSTDASNVEMYIATDEPLITIPNNYVAVGDIAAGDNAVANYIGIEADPSMQSGAEVDFTLDITADGGYESEGEFTITVGDERYQPSGPDSYGYWAYDPYDGNGAPSFDWIEIAPAAGGTGTNLNLGDDQTGHVNLPFSFMYYGTNYNEVSICSNGWIALGYSSSTAWTNASIPSGGSPNNMISLFWDDLNPGSGGQVCWMNDAANHRFIIEWYQVPHYPNTGLYTFQAILFDPAFYLTPTGDGEIQVNYASFSTSNSVTLGIENSNGSVGLEFLYNGAYDLHAMPLEPNFAIKYTTGVTMPELTIAMIPESTPIVIPASGGTFDYALTITNIGANYAAFSFWSDVIMPSGSLVGPILLRTGVALAPGGVIERDITQTVPDRAPAGDYTYQGHVGGYPSNSIADDSFPFEKEGVDFSGTSPYDDWYVSGWGEDDNAVTELPVEFFLSQNYPNPFNPETIFNFGLPEDGIVKLVVYNILGQRVATLVDGKQEAGIHSVKWDASRLSAGVYFYHLQAGDNSQIKKCILVK